MLDKRSISTLLKCRYALDMLQAYQSEYTGTKNYTQNTRGRDSCLDNHFARSPTHFWMSVG